MICGFGDNKPAIFAQHNSDENIIKSKEYRNDEMGQSMAVWMMDFDATPTHDFRFQCGYDRKRKRRKIMK